MLKINKSPRLILLPPASLPIGTDSRLYSTVFCLNKFIHHGIDIILRIKGVTKEHHYVQRSGFFFPVQSKLVFDLQVLTPGSQICCVCNTAFKRLANGSTRRLPDCISGEIVCGRNRWPMYTGVFPVNFKLTKPVVSPQ